MQVEINNDYMYTKPDEKCPRCGIPLNIRVVFHNTLKNCETHITYPYMKVGESMHMECYIEHVIDSYLELKMSRLQNDTVPK